MALGITPGLSSMPDRMDAWYDGSAVRVIAVSSCGDPLYLAEHEARALIVKLEAAMSGAQGTAISDKKAALRKSWEITIRHLAPSRFYLSESFIRTKSLEAERDLNHYLHNNELELALYAAESLGLEENAPSVFWRELYLAASNMGLAEEASTLLARSDA